MLLCNYETDYFLESITTKQGRRYNSQTKPLVARNISKDDVAGFFRSLLLDENHISILKLINKFTILDFDSIKPFLGYKFKECKKRIEECILTGLIFENHIKLDDVEYFWYMVDTGGLYVLDDMDMKSEYNHMPFTAGLDQKYKQYVKSRFLIDNYDLYTFRSNSQVTDKKGKSYGLIHLEEVRWSQLNKYDNTIFIVNLDVLENLRINDLLLKDVARVLSKRENTFYNIAQKSFLEICIDFL